MIDCFANVWRGQASWCRKTNRQTAALDDECPDAIDTPYYICYLGKNIVPMRALCVLLFAIAPLLKCAPVHSTCCLSPRDGLQEALLDSRQMAICLQDPDLLVDATIFVNRALDTGIEGVDGPIATDMLWSFLRRCFKIEEKRRRQA